MPMACCISRKTAAPVKNKDHIEVSTGLSKEEIEKNETQKQKQMPMLIKSERTNRKTQYMADSLIFQTEKQLKEYGDKLSPGNKSGIESALSTLKRMRTLPKIIDRIRKTTEGLNQAWQAASQEMYQAQQSGPGTQDGQADAGNAGGNSSASGNSGSDNVTDMEFESEEIVSFRDVKMFCELLNKF